jgi:hypothetical protein
MDEMVQETIRRMAESNGLSTEEQKKRLVKLIHKITLEEHSHLHAFQLQFYGTEEPSPEEWVRGLIAIMISDKYPLEDKVHACTAHYMASDPHVMREWYD